jgi:23S rRNA pseudouridine2457 synthase
MMRRYFLIYKPYGVLSQFTPEAAGQRTLADVFRLPGGVYPLGRLDQDSEGLLLLSDDPALNHLLLDPRHAHPRSYLAQVEGLPSAEALQRLAAGVEIRVQGRAYRTLPARVQAVAAPSLPPRDPPIRFRKTVPDAWVELTLTEGKNRQVRRMCAAVGLPVLRLVRVAIGGLGLGALTPGAQREISREELRQGLGI